MKRSTSLTPSASSPFDPFLARFLAGVRAISDGYSPAAHAKQLASLLDVDPAFVEALSTSARRRRFIEPFYAPAHRNNVRWRLSARGEEFLVAHGQPGGAD